MEPGQRVGIACHPLTVSDTGSSYTMVLECLDRQQRVIIADAKDDTLVYAGHRFTVDHVE